MTSSALPNRLWTTCLLALVLATVLGGCTSTATPPPSGTSDYRPQRGQIGKDVMWLPTSAALVNTMLSAAKVSSDDLVVDLGAGDGIIPIAAAQQFGARALGIEYNARLAAYAQQQVERAGVATRARIIQGDIFQEDFRDATVVTMYLLPELNQQLRPTLLAMKPGTRLVSHAFDMGDWEPDQVLGTERERAFLWVVPAQLEGTWQLRDTQGLNLGTFELRQRYQRVAGRMQLPGTPLAPAPQDTWLLGARVEGAALRFQFVGRDEGLHQVSLVLTGSELAGELLVHGASRPVRATRTP
jgi:SAM-dependent methyltransferase